MNVSSVPAAEMCSASDNTRSISVDVFFVFLVVVLMCCLRLLIFCRVSRCL